MPKAITNLVEVPGTHTLLQVPKRAFAFLATLGTQREIRVQMKARGYTQDDHLEGWRLLLKVTRSDANIDGALASVAATDALRELDEWDEVGFHTAHAALARRYPAQTAFLFQDLVPTQGRGAVLGIVTFLDRLDEIETGTGRTATQADDKKAIELLAARGITATERARLRTLIASAMSEPEIPKEMETAATRDADQTKDLEALYAWYAEWTEIAHAVVTRRNDRILLGIAKRRASDPVADTGTAAVPGTSPVPVTSAPAE